MVEICPPDPTDPPDPARDRLLWLADQYAEAQELISKGERRTKEVASELISLCQPGDRIQTRVGADGKPQGVRIQKPSMVWNANQAVRTLTPQQLASISEPKVSATLAKQYLPGALVDMCKLPQANPTVHLL